MMLMSQNIGVAQKPICTRRPTIFSTSRINTLSAETAQAILIVEALPISQLFSGRLAVQVLWKTVLYSIVVFVFKTLEEAIPLFSKHKGVMAVAQAMYQEVSWPLFVVLALWIIGGLFFKGQRHRDGIALGIIDDDGCGIGIQVGHSGVQVDINRKIGGGLGRRCALSWHIDVSDIAKI